MKAKSPLQQKKTNSQSTKLFDFGNEIGNESLFIPENTVAFTYQYTHLNRLFSSLQEHLDLERKISFPTRDGLVFFAAKNIVRLQGSNKYTKVFVKNNSNILSSYNIGRYVKIFNQFKFFFQSHKSHLINLNYVTKYSRCGLITLADDSTVPLSTKKRDLFLDLVQA